MTLEARGIHKSYGATRALRSVDLTVRPHEVHALLGANGAGKSTLVKILVGAETPDSGTLMADGEQLHGPAAAGRHGVALVSQELSQFPDLDVLSNLFLGREPRRRGLVNRAEMRRAAQPWLDRVGFHGSPDAAVDSLRLGERQLVEIAKALLAQPRYLLLDEPTSALAEAETARLHGVIRDLTRSGVGVIYVSHFLEQVLDVCDTVTVIRDGCTVLDALPAPSVAVPRLVEAIVGDAGSGRSRKAGADPPTPPPPRVRALGEGHDLMMDDVHVTGRLRGVSLSVRAGEIVGLAGLEGAGVESVFDVLFGLVRSSSGRVGLPGGGGAPRSPNDAVRRGVALVPSDRKVLGAMVDQSVTENVCHVRAGTLGRDGILLSPARLSRAAVTAIDAVGVRRSAAELLFFQLSGGNQQRVVFAKWAHTDPRLVLLDDPTRGVDVPARADLHDVIRDLAAGGRVVLVRSSHADELVELCDRVLVFRNGSLTDELTGPVLTEHDLMHAVNQDRPLAGAAATGKEHP
jgi:ABC-type sugar transport system ATPase subunit